MQNSENQNRGSFEFEHATPESVGVSSRIVLKCLREMEACGTELHGFTLYRKGKIIAQTNWKPYACNFPHTNHSMGKSYTAAAIGIACGDGLLSTEDSLADIFADELKKWNINPSPRFRRIKVKHLLSMSAGMKQMPPFTDNWVLDYLRSEPAYEPGEHFLYDTSGASLLGAILEKKTGMGLKEFLSKRLFNKIGIDPENFIWLKFPNGCNAEPGTCSTEEANLRLGLFYMNYGSWNGEQIASREWMEQATSRRIETNDGGEYSQGYGYQLWFCSTPETFRFDGGQGQFCVISRRLEMAASIHEGASVPEVTPHVLDVLLENLYTDNLPESLPEDKAAYGELCEYLSSRRLTSPQVCDAPEKAEKFNGVYMVREGNPNPWIEVCPGGVNFFDLFYENHVNPEIKTIKIESNHGECCLTMNERTVFHARFDGTFSVCDTDNVLPFKKTCCNAYFEEEKLCFDLRWLNGWFHFKMTMELQDNGTRLKITVRKNTLNEQTPYRFAEGSADRLIR